MTCLVAYESERYLGKYQAGQTLGNWPKEQELKFMHIDGPSFCLQICAMAFHPAGLELATADEDGNIMIWDLGEAKRLQTAQKHKGAIWSLSYSSGSGSLLASGGTSDATAPLIDSVSGNGCSKGLCKEEGKVEAQLFQLCKGYFSKPHCESRFLSAILSRGTPVSYLSLYPTQRSLENIASLP